MSTLVTRRPGWRSRAVRAVTAMAVALAGLPLLATGPAGAAFPGENGLIAFGDGGDIWVMNPDGTGRQNITDSLDALDAAPAWSPDGTRIAFESAGGAPIHDVFVMNADGTNPENLTASMHVTDGSPAWSPDGTRIAFISTRAGSFDVFVMNADGTNPENLTANSDASDVLPEWSPDGTQIAFYSNRAGSFDVFVMNADGTNPENLTANSDALDGAPAWSPDGTQIAFSSNRAGSFDVFVMNADGTNPENLTANSDALDATPAWSPDGTQIAFESDGSVSVMNADGTDPRNLGPGTRPDWQRVPAPPAPVAEDDVYYDVPRDATFTSPDSVLDNDTGENMVAVLDTDAGLGEVTLAADGGFTYSLDDPSTTETADTFTYTACNDAGCSDPATVTLNFAEPPVVTPVAIDDTYENVPRDATFTSPDSVLDNDSGPDLAALLVTDAQLGALSLSADGTFTYTLDDPDTTATSDTFTYAACSTSALTCSTAATVTLVFEEPPTEVATTISASRATYGFLWRWVKVGAQLSEAETGAPIPGQRIEFTVGEKFLCDAFTDAAGNAVCTSGIGGALTALLHGFYEATFDGNDPYLPSSTIAPA